MARTTVQGKKVGLHQDKTTTGATCLASISTVTNDGTRVLRVGDKATRCPQCKKRGHAGDRRGRHDIARTLRCR
ncbi:PAAR domain-containing protein [Providencia stuartii]|nr:PAAR domain-containing protein [Providencia stuartii]